MSKFVLFFFVFPIFIYAQSKTVTLSGKIQDSQSKIGIPYLNILLKNASDSTFVSGTISDENGFFTITSLKKGKYILEASYLGYKTHQQSVLIGQLSDYLDLGTIDMFENSQEINEITVTAKQNEIAAKMDKKTYSVAGTVSQSGGSVLQVMSNLPSVTVSQDGKVQLRGSDKVTILIDGKQTALTGFDSQKGLDNLPASSIESIEIINNPSSKYDANGNAGIVNIIFKKDKKNGFHGQFGFALGAGALWVRRENLPNIRPQFEKTPKYNPSVSLNYRKNKINLFFQGDRLYTKTLNKNEFSTRKYNDGTFILQQVKRNRTTTYETVKTGVDYNFDAQNTLSISGLFNRETIDDRGDNPYFLGDLNNLYRLWQFIEDEVKYTASATSTFVHKFAQAGHYLQFNGNYYFHREDEKYFFSNFLPTSEGSDAFALLSDEHVGEASIDYIKPLKQGRFETGMKFRKRSIPTNMQFFAGANSPIDTNAGGWATYKELIPAVYGNYVFETTKFEIESGLRMEYVKVNYEVNPNHNTYTSDGYSYTQPFPNVRFAYKINDVNKVSLFYNRRVDRPNEVDIRIFPKYDEPELLKVGNPTLKPQFTNTLELGYKNILSKGSFYAAVYHRITDGTITRIATRVPNAVILYNVFQNAGRSFNTGLEVIFQQKPIKWLSFTTSANVYRNIINAFSVNNKYPAPTLFTAAKQQRVSVNFKVNATILLKNGYETQVSSIYLAPDIVPQGKVLQRYSLDFGVKKQIRKGRGEIFLNATDVLNTMQLRKEILGNDFVLISEDYYETQLVRLGFGWKF
jgi:outer membrane receptor protein involved in Fe transport